MQALLHGPVLPMPGVVWGLYPRRREEEPAAMVKPAPALPALSPVRAAQEHWLGLDDTAWTNALADLRARLARDGFDRAALRDEALGCAAAACQRTLARDPYDVQLAAACIILGDAFAEMATGEGKTLALGLAAAVAALAGVPVHLITANDYLAARDAELLAPMYRALGLAVGTVLGGMTADERRAAYRAPVTYGTAREIAFDHLRDLLAEREQPGLLERRTHPTPATLSPSNRSDTPGSLPGGAAPLSPDAAHTPLLRGLCMAIVDEADSVLIDEGSMPLLLAEAVADPQQRAACFQALALARAMRPGVHMDIGHLARRITWRDAGEQWLDEQAAGLGGAWLHRQHRRDLVGAALEALHLLHKDHDYLVRDGRVELLDPVTGRTAPGRVWSRGLQTLVELKEGCTPSPATTTRAQISAQRFFGRYVRLAGMSGTLAECREELATVYGRAVVPIPPRRPSRLQVAPVRWCLDERERQAAAVAEVLARHGRGQPVLIGTDSVEASEAYSRRLAAAGIAHQVLNARHDRDEAAIVAQAGQSGAVTVATHMAGRGTDIALGPGVAECGGLHVLACQDNPSARLDRQLIGRAGRQGEPGSAEVLRRLDAPQWQGLAALAARLAAPGAPAALRTPLQRLADTLAARTQQSLEQRGARERRRLLEQDRKWHT